MMFIRTSVIGLLIPAIVLLGNNAHAGSRHVHTRPNQRITVNVYGSNNIIATDGSVLTVGHHGQVNANTGDVSSSGTLGIDTDRSSLESGAGTTSAAGHSTDNARLARGPSRAAGDSTQGESTAISGYEDHSVRVAGEDQMAVYDDSNLFVDRNGKLNGNTGDTDSSGLNAVDVSGSTVRSGNHIEDDEGSADEKDTPGARPAGRLTRPTGTRPPSNAHASSTVTDEGESGAKGANTLTIGGDGYDNLGLHVAGKRNIAAYDDSNVVVGGTGDVNAQIGDSDTSGAVVMGIDHSALQSGNST